jgi:hypothetical protein
MRILRIRILRIQILRIRILRIQILSIRIRLQIRNHNIDFEQSIIIFFIVKKQGCGTASL